MIARMRALTPAVLNNSTSVDPLGSGYPWYKPYQFAGNIPTAGVDIDGCEFIAFGLFEVKSATGRKRYIAGSNWLNACVGFARGKQFICGI